MARDSFNQHFTAEEGELLRENDKPVGQLDGYLGVNGSARLDGVGSEGQRSALAQLNGEGARLNGETAHLTGEAVHLNGGAPHLNGEAVHLNGEAPHLNREAAHLNGKKQTGLREALTRPKEHADRLVPAGLLLAVGASLLWLVWLRPACWQDGLAIAVAAGLAIWKSRWLKPLAFAGRVVTSPARYFIRRIGVLNRTQRLWSLLPEGARATICLLVLLNTLIALALLDTTKLSSGVWAVHTTIAFVVMSCVNILLLKSSLSSSPLAKPVASRVYFSPLEAVETAATDRSDHNGVTQDHQHLEEQDHPHLEEKVERPQLSSAGSVETQAEKSPKFKRLRLSGFSGKLQTRVAVGTLILAVGWISYAHPGPLLTLAVLVVGPAVLSTMGVSREQAITMMLAIALAVATVDYMSWRFSVTNWQGWWIAVPLLAAEALGAIHVLGFQSTVWPWPTPQVESGEDLIQREIFLLIPTINEGVVTLRPTLEGCIAAREKYLAQYPNGQVTIVICNDGRVGNYPRWAEIELLARELGVRCVTRSIGGGAKAGNIENVRQTWQITGNALMAIFDADQVPAPDFLLKTIPPFANSKIGWVQTGQYYANLNNPVSRWADDQQSLFYNLMCPGKAALNSAFICGTNVVIRAAALDEIGGLPQDSVTEDFAASIRLHQKWRSIYLSDVLATGLGPLDVPSYLKQQGRWALGTLSVFRDNWRDILLPRKNGLRFGQRVQYFLACTHYLCGLRDLIYVLSPVLFIFTGIPAVRTATLNQYMAHFVPYGVLGLVTMWYSTRGITGLRGIIIGFGSSPALIGSLAAAILRRKKPFAVTSKEHRGQRSLRYLGVYILPLLLCIFALAWITQVTGRQQTSLFISVLWITYSLLLLASFLWLAYKDIRLQRAVQPSGTAEITAKRPYPSKLAVRQNALIPVLTLGLAALIASPLLVGTRLASSSLFEKAATPFLITQQQINSRYTGLSLPVQMLSSQPPVLERALGVHFSVIGRTQDINDQFDAPWAGKLATQGARPWIDLSFGAFGAHKEPPLTASLPAIYNGADDRQIRRWAAEIRNFGKPVYLTVLLQADRNWAVSSGVANGGIPQDVPKAWMHIQSVFHAVGADNVAWVWAPADPLNDQQFAPPQSTIDVVLQDFIGYPGTRWGDPQKALRSLAQRYPGKPFFVEVSVSGQPKSKAAWLAKLGQAVNDTPQVYALLYHQGGPDLKPTPAQAKSWSLASDPQSLAAWKRIVTSMHTAGRLP